MLAYFTLQFFRVAEMTYFHMSLLCFREHQAMKCMSVLWRMVGLDDLVVTEEGAEISNLKE